MTAEEHRANASTTRLGAGVTRAQNVTLLKAAQVAATKRLGQPNASKTKNVLAVAQARRQGKIQLQATLWTSRLTKKGIALIEDPRINQSQFYPDDETVESAFVDMVGRLKSLYEEHHPDRYDRLTRVNVTFHAHKNKSTYTALPLKEWGYLSVQELMTRLAALDFLTEAQVKAGLVLIRILIPENILDPPDDSELEYTDSRMSFTTAHSSRRPPSAAASVAESGSISRKRKASGSGVLPSESAKSQQGSHLRRTSETIVRPRRSAIRASAHIPQLSLGPVYSRNATMTKYTFVRLEFNELNNTFTEGPGLGKSDEVIEISDNWKIARLSGNKTGGYLGSGSSKDVIYARYCGQEYAFGQVKDGVTEEANEDILKGEYETLFDANKYANEFKGELRALGVQFPGFYFNIEQTFIGRLLGPVDPAHDSSNKPHFRYFIASRLLPCGPADGAVVKYTGNDDVGPLPKDSMTALLHAYTHYTYVYTSHQVLICDLQGLFDKDKTLCLFDPQAHTDESDPSRRVYWDGGHPRCNDSSRTMFSRLAAERTSFAVR